MKKYLIIIIITYFSINVFSQDLIITNEGDTLNCKITKVKTDNIYFTFKHKEEIRNTLLPLLSVKTYKYDYFTTSEVPKEKIKTKENYQKVRLALNGGYSNLTGKVGSDIPADFKNYVTELKSGFHFAGDLTYYISEPIGIGLKYSLFKTSNSISGVYIENEFGQRSYGKMSDDISVSFIGPMFSTRMLSDNKKNSFFMNLAFGYMIYNDDLVIIRSYRINGNTIGLAYELGYDIDLSKNMALCFHVSFISGTLSEYDLYSQNGTQKISLEKGKYEGLGRIDFSVGFSFGK